MSPRYTGGVSEPLERAALGERPHLDERPTYEPRARQEWFIVTRLAEAIPAAVRAWAPGGDAGGGGRALDVGCGRQPFRGLIESLGLAYVGLDTQQNAEGTVAHVCPIDGELPGAVTAGGGYRFILCTEVMEHVADWPAAFANFVRLLAPGGRLLITCPHVYPLHEEPYDFWRPTPYALKYFAARYGLKVVEQRRVGDGWDVLGTVLAATAPRARGGNPLAVLLAGVAQLKRKVAVWMLKRAFVHRWVEPRGSLYLSNLIVLEAPG